MGARIGARGEDDAAFCLVCGKEITSDDRFIVLVDPRAKATEHGTLIAGVFVGSCCVDVFDERGELFDAEEFFSIMFEEDDDE